MNKHHAVALAAVSILGAGGCGTSTAGPTPTPGSACTNRENAIGIARANADSSTPATMVSVVCTRFGDVAGGSQVLSPATMVWSVVFNGTYRSSCGGVAFPPHTAPACLPAATTKRVVVDATGSRFVMGMIPAQ